MNDGLEKCESALGGASMLSEAKALTASALLAYRRNDLEEGDRLVFELEDMLEPLE